MNNESDKALFLEMITKHLGNNLNNYLIDSLSNILTIDYINRLKKEPEINNYIKNCIVKLRAYLKRRMINEEDFSTTLSLFVIAISNKTNNDEELVNEQENIIDGLISTHFIDTSAEDQKNMKQVLKLMLIGTNAKDIINSINQDPKLFHSLVTNTYKTQKDHQEAAKIAANNINKIITETKLINKKVGINKSLFNKIALATGLIAVASLTGLVGGLLLPAILAPTAAISIKLAPNVGGKISSIFSQKSDYIQKKQTKINEIISIILPIASPSLEQDLLQKKSLAVSSEAFIKPSLAPHSRNQDLSKKNARQR